MISFIINCSYAMLWKHAPRKTELNEVKLYSYSESQ